MHDIHIELDGRALEAAFWGPPPATNAPTLVLLHEGLGAAGLWRDTPSRLAAATGYGVFAYSRFGYGRSATTPLPRPLTYMHDEAGILRRVLDAAGIRRCILIGHSDGASIATIYAGSSQDFRVRGLVLIAPHFFVEDINLAHIATIRKAYEEGDLRRRLARHHSDVDAAFRGWNDAWLDPAFRDWDLRADLAHIRIPLLLVQGLNDPFATAAQPLAAETETYCPVEILAVPDAGHAPHHDAAECVAAAITAFTHRLFKYHEL